MKDDELKKQLKLDNKLICELKEQIIAYKPQIESNKADSQLIEKLKLQNSKM